LWSPTSTACRNGRTPRDPSKVRGGEGKKVLKFVTTKRGDITSIAAPKEEKNYLQGQQKKERVHVAEKVKNQKAQTSSGEERQA